jgi:hypothetical protein
MEASMRRVVLFILPAVALGCHAHVQAAAPEPAGEVVVVAPPPPPAEAVATVDVEAVQEGEPEEVTATSEPPDLIYEERTDSPGESYVWVAGYWGWTGADWRWYWGRWERVPADGRIYIEPYYERVGDRVVYVHGYWGRPGAPRRAYGGDRIQFTAAVRPVDYHRGQHAIIERRPGLRPGERPGSFYAHATGSVRSIPRETTPHAGVAVREGATKAPDEAMTHEMRSEQRSPPSRAEPRHDGPVEHEHADAPGGHARDPRTGFDTPRDASARGAPRETSTEVRTTTTTKRTVTTTRKTDDKKK